MLIGWERNFTKENNPCRTTNKAVPSIALLSSYFLVLQWTSVYSYTVLTLFYLLCMGTTGVCGGEGAERAAGGGVLDPPSPSDVGPDPLRTEPSRSVNFVAAEWWREGHGSALKWTINHSGVAALMTTCLGEHKEMNKPEVYIRFIIHVAFSSTGTFSFEVLWYFKLHFNQKKRVQF